MKISLDSKKGINVKIHCGHSRNFRESIAIFPVLCSGGIPKFRHTLRGAEEVDEV